ncbi:hypothetical protein CWE08_00300 [Aliidiomarina iranensis]|uniref:Alpha-2-macroglobulin domain-containing protein n=1 Tax=Aliidiomarina iranensis TaxID=1434071 RepID=A0A432W1M5_9GAMM|nr:alpha-2-macroglobulin family protein [Aliidiomarina iranensis]RUO23130.1 hypothetical protein CWE08_00300 [Aliidiomarina iranensis]
MLRPILSNQGLSSLVANLPNLRTGIVSLLMAFWVTGWLSACSPTLENTPSATASTASNASENNDVIFTQNDASGKDVRQLRFQFSEQIAIAGALPRREQVAAIHFEGEHFPGCAWRFLNTKTLACELEKPLPLSSEFRVLISAEFATINQPLGANYRFTVTTPAPESLADIFNDNVSITFNTDLNERQIEGWGYAYPLDDTRDVLAEFSTTVTELIELKRPNGELLPINGEIEIDDGYLSWRTQLTLPDAGLYQLQIPAGSLLPGTNQPLPETLIIHKARIYNQLRWLGYRCVSHDSEQQAWILDDAEEYVAECPSAGVEMRFSHTFPTQKTWGTSVGRLLHEYPWLSAPAYPLDSYNDGEESLFVVTFLPLPDTNYEIDLNGIWLAHFANGMNAESSAKPRANNEEQPSIQIEAPTQGVIKVKTRDFPSDWWPAWQQLNEFFDNPFQTVLRLTDDQPAQASIRYSDPIQLQVQALTSANELAKFLSNSFNLTPFEWQLDEQSNGNLHQLPLDELLGPSGVLYVEGPSALPKKPGFIQRDSFLLDVLYASEWTIFTWDLAGAALPNVAIYQVCAGESEPALLGVTGADGVLVSAPQWPLEEDLECWLWATAASPEHSSEKHASIALTLRGARFEFAQVTGSLIPAQKHVRYHDTLHFLIELRNRYGEKLDSEELEVSMRSDNQVYPVTVSAISTQGLASGAVQFTEDMAAGSYWFRVSYQGKLIDSESIELTKFIAPELDLSMQAELQLENTDWWFLRGELQRISTAAMSNQAVDITFEFDSSKYIPQQSGWPESLDYGFSLEEANTEYDFEHRVLLQTANNGEFTLTARENAEAAETQGFAAIVPQLSPNTQGYLRWEVSIGTVSGEPVVKSDSQVIYGLPAYPGLIRRADSDVEVRLINAEGQWASNDFVAEFYELDNENNLLNACEGENGSARCELPEGKDFLLKVRVAEAVFERILRRIEIEQLQRPTLDLPDAFFVAPGSVLPANEDAQNLETENVETENLGIENISAGNNTVSVNSPTARSALLLVYSDKLEHKEWIALAPGENSIPIPVIESWGAAVEVALAYMEAGAIKFTSDAVNIRKTQQRLQLDMRSHSDVLTVGEPLHVRFYSEQDAEVQLWFVDEGLVVGNLAEIPTKKQIQSDDAREWQSAFSYFSNHRSVSIPPEPQGFYSGLFLDEESVAQIRRRSASPMQPGMGLYLGEHKVEAEQLVLWQKPIQLTAGEEENVEFNLPPRPTGWRLVAVAATADERYVLNESVSVQAPFEFSVEAAEDSFEGDELQLALSATNRSSDQRVIESVVVKLNHELLEVVSFQLEPNESQRQTIKLPGLTVGRHQVIVSHQGSEQARTVALSVRPEHIFAQQRIFPEGANTFSWQQPDGIDEVEFYQLEGELALDWHLLREQMLQNRVRSWQQRLNAALLLAMMPEAHVEDGDEALVGKLLAEPFGYFGRRFQTFPNYDITFDDWLTAYSILLLQRFQDQRYQEYADRILQQFNITNELTQILETSSNLNARALALWALTDTADINYADYQALAEHLRVGADSQARLLYLASLSDYAEAEPIIDSLVAEIASNNYQSQAGTMFTSNLERCLSLHGLSYQRSAGHSLGISSANLSYQQESLNLLAMQRERGDFGDAYSNGFCLLALHAGAGSQETESAKPEITVNADTHADIYSSSNGEQPVAAKSLGLGRWQIENSSGAAPMFARYKADYQSLPELAQSLSLQRNYEILQRAENGENAWQPLTADTPVALGDVIRVTLRLTAPMALSDVVVRDFIPGGWYANQSGFWAKDSPCYRCYQEVEGQQIALSQHYIPAGVTTIQYQVQVRNSGTYLAPGATAEALFRGDVQARTESTVWEIQSK